MERLESDELPFLKPYPSHANFILCSVLPPWDALTVKVSSWQPGSAVLGLLSFLSFVSLVSLCPEVMERIIHACLTEFRLLSSLAFCVVRCVP